VSAPSVKSAGAPAPAAAEPPLEPPGTREVSRGFLVGPYDENSVEEPMPNSSMFSMPSRTAPASFSRAVAVASYGGT
jgi:hypothetical protein